jgi:hypothetical protein
MKEYVVAVSTKLKANNDAEAKEKAKEELVKLATQGKIIVRNVEDIRAEWKAGKNG